MSRRQESLVGMPPDCSLIAAQLIRPGDRVRFRMPSVDYTVTEVERCEVGVRHRHGDGLQTCAYHPNELLWITRRADPAGGE